MACDEIAPHGRLARGHGGERRVVVVEQVDQALPRVLVVLDPLVEVGLLEDDAVVDAGARCRCDWFAGQHLAVIGLGLAGERGQQVVPDAADVQFQQLPAAAGRDQGDQLVVGQADFLPGVEIEVVGRGLDPGLRASARPVQQVVGGDQAAVDGVAEVRQVDAAEGPVPVAAVALAAVELRAGLLDQRAGAPRRRSPPASGG